MIDQLVDTRVLILFLQGHSELPEGLARLIESPDRRTLISMASLWEMARKEAMGLLRFECATRSDFPELLRDDGFEVLPLSWSTLRRASQLPELTQDETDRILVAEAIARQAPLLSLDHKLDGYQIERISS